MKTSVSAPRAETPGWVTVGAYENLLKGCFVCKNLGGDYKYVPKNCLSEPLLKDLSRALDWPKVQGYIPGCKCGQQYRCGRNSCNM